MTRASLSRPPAPAEQHLFAALCEARRRAASATNVAPLIVASDDLLRGVCAARPATVDALARVPGVGAAQVAKYGRALVAACIAAAKELGLGLSVANVSEVGSTVGSLFIAIMILIIFVAWTLN